MYRSITTPGKNGRAHHSCPAGALDSGYDVTIEPIFNLAHDAKGPAYRISPEGLNTPVPMTLTFKVDPVSVRGMALKAMTVATQDADGRWTWARAPQRNTSTSPISIETHHFSDWVLRHLDSPQWVGCA